MSAAGMQTGFACLGVDVDRLDGAFKSAPIYPDLAGEFENILRSRNVATGPAIHRNKFDISTFTARSTHCLRIAFDT